MCICSGDIELAIWALYLESGTARFLILTKGEWPARVKFQSQFDREASFSLRYTHVLSGRKTKRSDVSLSFKRDEKPGYHLM